MTLETNHVLRRAGNAMTAILTVLLAGPAGADTTVSWCGGSASWDTSSCWDLPDPCYPDNGNCLIADPWTTESSWHAIVNGTGPVLTLNFSVTLTDMTFNGGWINTAADQSSVLTIEDDLVWGNGITDAVFGGPGSVISEGSAAISGPAELGDRNFLNKGSATSTGVFSAVTGTLGLAIVNEVGATWDMVGDGQILGYNVPQPTFTNHSILLKTGGGESLVDIVFDSPGEIQVLDGTLNFADDGSAQSTIFVEATGELKFTHDFTLDTGSFVNGPGDVWFGGGSVDVLGMYTVDGTTTIDGDNSASVDFIGLTVTDDLVISGCCGHLAGIANVFGHLTLGGSTIDGAVVAHAGGVIGDPTHTPSVDGGVLELFGSGYTLTGKGMSGTDGAWAVNHVTGVLEMDCISNTGLSHVAFTPMSTFINDGELRKINGNFNPVGWAFENQGLVDIQGGTLFFTESYLQNWGETRLSGGTLATWSSSVPIEIVDGSFTGSGDVNGPLHMQGGTLEPGVSAGAIDVSGTVTLDAAATYVCEVGGTLQGTGYDYVEGQQFLLAGALQVQFIDGFEANITPTDEFVVMDSLGVALPIVGAFGNVANGGAVVTADGNGVFTVHYGPGSIYPTHQVVLTNYQPLAIGDLNGDGSVGVPDLLALFAEWGPCPGPPDPCPADLNGDGSVGVPDMLIMFANWG